MEVTNKVHLMSEELSNKIAAGEVVEKVMNVVKELVENSIDALSTEIKIALVESGIKEITVSDDGLGMDEEDAVLAFSRHATSKLLELDDLFSINTLGFRGEALPSIAAISELVLKTSNTKTGTMVVINGGKIIEVLKSDLRKGTIITVKNLFYNTPVRLKYLNSLYSELANTVDYVNKMALSYPNIRFTLTNNDKVLLSTDGSNNLLKVINSIYGLEVSKKMLELDSSNEDYQLSGYISYPEIARSSKSNMTVLVNNRVIRNNEIIKTVLEAYHTYIPVDKYPIMVLKIEVDPSLIDVNIHPTKMDIKFSKLEKLKELINETINKKLKEALLIPEIRIDREPLKEDFSSLEIKKDIEPDLKYEDLSFNLEVSDNHEEDVKESRIKEMYPVGLVHGTYIIAENEIGMFIIDQHAAAERVNYEKYLNNLMQEKVDTINLLVPITIELTNKEYLILKEHFQILEELKIDYEEFGLNTIMIRSHPVWLPKYALEESIRKIIEIIIDNLDFNLERFREKVAITLACKLSIKGNMATTSEDMTYLIEALRKTNNPFTCPHGRPTIITYSKYDLEKLFKRAE